jgi:hypothetical protein
MVTEVIKTRVSPDTKARVNEAAQRQLLPESVWLRRAVDAALRSAPVSEDGIDPEGYLRYVLTNIAEHPINPHR